MKKSNHLATQKSPYLLQHMHNPINWFPWSDEALQKALNENKPLFISIGYSTCHWCHVMAKESFENEEIAKVLNEHFVAIKVDREERADIDSIYMNACINMNGHGGWPLTTIALPSQKPFFTATYLPPTSSNGRTGLMELLQNVVLEWGKNRERLEEYGEEFSGFLKNQNDTQRDSTKKGREIFHKTFEDYQKSFDKVFGGFGTAPKFPSPHTLMFLLRYYHYEKNEKALVMVEKTLESMYRGGIFDHIGGGFCRYSTDKMWLVPHFEKMLYDNALLIMVYTEAYQITKNDLYRHIAQTTIEFVIRELNSVHGGFYTALDADSSGEEGLYYLFDYKEIVDVLKDDAEEFCEHFNIKKDGNYEGKNVINIIGGDLEKSEKIEAAVQKLYHYRRGRHSLHTDDKVMPSMNALMISALIKAYKVFKMDSYRILAQKAVDFVMENIIDEQGNIFVSYRKGRSDILGGLDDYAYFCMALIDMYEGTFETKYLGHALKVCQKMKEHFLDEQGGFFLNDKRADNLIYRPKDFYDGALPSGNSVAGYALNKLAKLTLNEDILSLSTKQSEYLASVASDNGSHLSFALIALMQLHYPTKEIIAIAKSNKDIATLKEKQKEFLPETNIMVKFIDGEDPTEYAEYLKDYEMKNNTTTYYICENNTCNMKNKL